MGSTLRQELPQSLGKPMLEMKGLWLGFKGRGEKIHPSWQEDGLVQRAVGSWNKLPQEAVSSPSWGRIRKNPLLEDSGKKIHALGGSLER